MRELFLFPVQVVELQIFTRSLILLTIALFNNSSSKVLFVSVATESGLNIVVTLVRSML